MESQERCVSPFVTDFFYYFVHEGFILVISYQELITSRKERKLLRIGKTLYLDRLSKMIFLFKLYLGYFGFRNVYYFNL